MKKLWMYMILVISIIFMLGACTKNEANSGNNTNSTNDTAVEASANNAGDGEEMKIYDDDSKIVSEGDNCALSQYGSEDTGSGYKFTLGDFSGGKTIYHLNAKADSTVDVKFDCKTESGKFKCVFIGTDNKITNIVEQNGNGNLSLKLAKGENRIKIVGLSAKVELTVDVKNQDSNVEIECIN